MIYTVRHSSPGLILHFNGREDMAQEILQRQRVGEVVGSDSNGSWIMGPSRVRLVLLTMCLVVGSGAFLSATLVEAATPMTRPTCDQCEEVAHFVRLQPVSGESHAASARHFTHPFVLPPEEWTALLGTLQIQRQAEGLLFRDPPGPVLPAFTPEDISYLSVALSQAFAQAQPHEMVVFGLSRLNAYQMTEITTGGWFVDGPSMHVVLANYRQVVTMPSTRWLLWERPLRSDAGPRYDLIPGHHQTMVRESSVISSLFSSPPSELVMDYSAILLSESVEDLTRQESPAPLVERGPFSTSLESRFRLLKQLHEQGLISEEEYRTKKQQLLERF